MPGLAGLSCKSKAVVLTAFCSSPVSRARLSVDVSAMRNSMTLDLEYLHHLVAEMVDHLHGDAAGFRLVERTGRVAVQGRPRLGVDLGLKRGFQGVVGIVGPKEIGVAHE